VGFEHVSEFADPVVEVGDFGAVEPPEDLEVAVGHLDRARNVSPRVLWDGHRLVVADARREELFGDLFGRAVFEVGFEVVDEQEERTRVGAVSEPVLDPLVGPSGSVVVLAAEELSVDGICDVGDGVSGEEPAGECFEFVCAPFRCILNLRDGLRQHQYHGPPVLFLCRRAVQAAVLSACVSHVQLQ